MKGHDESYYAFKPIYDNPIILDFSGCRYPGEIHKVLKDRFGFPEYYGENWSALWDCLRYLFDKGEELSVEIYGFYSLEKKLREYCANMLEVFNDVHEETPSVSLKLIS